MNHQYLKLFLLFAINIIVTAQSIDRNVISAAGGSAVVNGQYIDWTIGESVIETIHNNNLIISEGFHQPIETIYLYRIDGNILGGGFPYSDVEVFLFKAYADTSLPALSKSAVADGSFSFTFLPDDNYLIYAVPNNTDEYYPTYYLQTINRSKAYILEADANIGGLDLRLVSKADISIEPEPFQNLYFSVFPNPFIDNLTVSVNSEDHSIVTIKIIDLTGKKVFSQNISSNDISTINLAFIPDGLFIINIASDLGTCSKLVSKTKHVDILQ